MSQILQLIKLLSSVPALLPLITELVTLIKSGTATIDQYLAWAMKLVAIFVPVPTPTPGPTPQPFIVGAADSEAEITAAVAAGCDEGELRALIEAVQ